MAQKFLFLVKSGIFYEFLKSGVFCPRPGKRETGTSDVVPGHQPQAVTEESRGFLCAPVRSIFTRLTFVICEHVNRDMASNDFSPTSSSDSEVSEIDDYDLEVEGSPNLSATASDEGGTQEAYADDPLAARNG